MSILQDFLITSKTRCSRSQRRLQIRAVRTGLDAERNSNSASFSHPRKAEFSVHMRSSAWRVECYLCNQTSWTYLPTVILRCWFQSLRLEPREDASGMEPEPQLSVRCPLDLHYCSGQNECLCEVVWRVHSFTRIGVTKSAVFVSTAFLSHVGED